MRAGSGIALYFASHSRSVREAAAEKPRRGGGSSANGGTIARRAARRMERVIGTGARDREDVRVLTPDASPRPFLPSSSQRDAIEAEPHSLLVLAGPGAGKTYCLTERIHCLIERHG